jgi:hypothetical protein
VEAWGSCGDCSPFDTQEPWCNGPPNQRVAVTWCEATGVIISPPSGQGKMNSQISD